jgi:hypothetical protein
LNVRPGGDGPRSRSDRAARDIDFPSKLRLESDQVAKLRRSLRLRSLFHCKSRAAAAAAAAYGPQPQALHHSLGRTGRFDQSSIPHPTAELCIQRLSSGQTRAVRLGPPAAGLSCMLSRIMIAMTRFTCIVASENTENE